MTALAAALLAAPVPALRQTIPPEAPAGGISPASDDKLEVRFLDVGYGAATLLKMGDVAALVDAGTEAHGPEVTAALRAAGVKRLAWVCITHFHPDHTGGLRRVLADFPIGTLYANQDPAVRKPEHDDFGHWLGESGRAVEVLSAGDMLSVGRATVRVLAPGPALQHLTDDNARAVVLGVRHREVGVLLLADATVQTDPFLLRRWKAALRAEVAQIPHHGWGDVASPALVEAVDPRVVVLSIGPSRWPAPDPDVLARFGRARLLRTDRHGTIVLVTDGERLTLTPARGAVPIDLDARRDALASLRCRPHDETAAQEGLHDDREIVPCERWPRTTPLPGPCVGDPAGGRRPAEGSCSLKGPP